MCHFNRCEKNVKERLSTVTRSLELLSHFPKNNLILVLNKYARVYWRLQSEYNLRCEWQTSNVCWAANQRQHNVWCHPMTLWLAFSNILKSSTHFLRVNLVEFNNTGSKTWIFSILWACLIWRLGYLQCWYFRFVILKTHSNIILIQRYLFWTLGFGIFFGKTIRGYIHMLSTTDLRRRGGCPTTLRNKHNPADSWVLFFSPG